MISRFTSRPSLQVVATAVVTALSLGLIGGVVVLTSTSAGCGPAAKLGLKGVNHHCTTTASVIPLASPTTTSSPNPYSPPVYVPITPAPSVPFNPPASAPAPPYIGPVSSAYPPFAFGVSSSGGGPIVASYPVNSCSLAVYAGPPGSGGFIQFPGGKFVTASDSVVALPSPGLPLQQGYGYPGGMSYDRFYSRWLPVQPSLVSPDGSHYAYATTDGVYVVDVAMNTQTEHGSGRRWTIAGLGTQGVYASVVNQGGLWLMPFFSSTLHQITAAGFWQAVGAGAAWGTATSAVPQGVANTIIRLDLTSGAISDWFTRPGAASSVLGVDGDGKPVVYVQYFDYNGASEVWLAAGITSFPIFGTLMGLYEQGAPIADDHGIWFPIANQPKGAGVALFVPGSGLYWMTSYGVQLAGGCH